MNEKVKEFLKRVNQDEALKKELIEMNEKTKDTEDKDKVMAEYILPFAKKNGYDLTAADFESQDAEMSADELMAVSGGACVCAVGGQGEGDNAPTNNMPYTCICMVIGEGGGYADDSPTCCLCPLMGGGDY